ncbi:hypothetical protein KDD30_10835 [Photobacterium sp. GJ3]|uniref:hypothetical protein n=1 Tax=Photobacterium sp. GJ3 TaxID=2829502 RepID=UPI001B8D9D8B|nr:hypothetical protein [Photobacterium sp. GJ3]QUJ66653.1 hypothetical protein KDD30_10835 [Photobacterium sp. GJ3]
MDKINMSQYTPIPFKPLWNDFWVFSLYGFIASFFMALYIDNNASLENIESIVFEPFSVRAFFMISTSGFLLVAIRAMMLGMDAERASQCWLMRKFFVPISEVGLSAGFIIMGMSAGIMTYFFTFGAAVEGAWDLSVVNLKVFLLVAFIIIPVYWFQRRIFALARSETLLLTGIIVLYLLTTYLLLWVVDPTKFWIVSIFTGVILASAWLGVKYLSNRKTAQPIRNE